MPSFAKPGACSFIILQIMNIFIILFGVYFQLFTENTILEVELLNQSIYTLLKLHIYCMFCFSELHLATTWPHLTEGIIVDNDVYS